MGLFHLFRGSKRTTTILPTDIVVFIVGATGSGKSWFMSTVLKNANVYVQVRKGQRPGTTEVHAERCRFNGMRSDIVIVDTPSFDTDGEEAVRMWMESNYTRPCRWAGILYMHNLAFNHEDASLRLSDHLGAFRRACRRNLFPSVIHVVPTLSVGTRVPAEKLRTLTAQLQRQADDAGALLHSTFDGEPETAWDIVQGLLSHTESSAAMPHIVSSQPRSKSDNRPVSSSLRRQASDERAQPKKPEVAENDYVIFVVGPTGAGKTWFTRQLSKSRYVAQGGHPRTRNVEAWRCRLGNGPVNTIVVDTPSFHTGRDNFHAESTITEWLESNFTNDTFEKCHPGILFLHSLDSDPTCDEMLMSRHLETFAKAFPSKFKVPSRVYVVPTSNSNSTLSSEKLGQRLSQLNAVMEALNGHGNCTRHASMFPGIFKGQPETAWSAALLLLKDISQTQAKESTSSRDGSALKDLADLLFKEFRKISRSGDPDAIITFGRTAMEFTPPEHPQRYSALINLADLLSERFNEEGSKEDLDEVIALRRDASKGMSPDDSQGLAIHLELDKSLSRRFESRGALMDLEEIISLRRVVSKSTPAPDQYKPLLGLADSLYDKYQKLGSVDDLEEALKLVHTTSQLCPIKHPDLVLSQKNLAHSLKDKVRKGLGTSG